jgi:hypothetical protein
LSRYIKVALLVAALTTIALLVGEMPWGPI